MNVVLLRKLALKSILGFGKYAELSVQQCISLGHTRYLRWCYYNCSNIDFNDEIKGMISIYEDRCIKKPGVNPEIGELIDSAINKHLFENGNLVKLHARLKKTERIEIYKKRRSFSYMESKSIMQARNHGR